MKNPGCYPFSVEEVDDGVFFVCDENGPIFDSPVDCGPFSVRADAEYCQELLKDLLEDEYTQFLIDLL